MWRQKKSVLSGLGLIVVFGFLYGCTKTAEQNTDVAALYNKQCAVCHGQEGKGDGKAAYLLLPRPRDFTSGKFRLTTTDNGVPSDRDLFDAITRGMPGSAMPSWSHLPEKDRWDLVRYIRELAHRGAEETTNLIPGKTRELPPFLSASDAEELLRKEKLTAEILYRESCATCHGEKGKGDGTADMKDESGFRLPPRDFTRGILKGNADTQSLAHRLYGMPGSAMPDSGFSNEEGKYLWALVHYIRGMMPDNTGIQEQVHYKRTILARRAREIPADLPDSAWNAVQPIFIPLMQLWQGKEFIQGVSVRAMHDGTRVAFQITWPDSSKNDTQSGVASFGDAVALQFSKSSDLSFFAMGDFENPVAIWMWKAVKQNAEQIAPSASRHSAARDAGNIVSGSPSADSAENLKARGFGTLETQGNEKQTVRGKAVYQNGAWHIVLHRACAGSDENDITFKPGETVRIGFAVWDGAQNDRDGQKSVTVWHDLVLE